MNQPKWTPRPGQVIRNRHPYPGEPSYLVERGAGDWVYTRMPNTEVWDGWSNHARMQMRLEAVREFYEGLGEAEALT